MSHSAIRPLAATHFREALAATANGEPAQALAALMHIDPESWAGIQHRLAALGTDLLDVLAHTAATGGTK
ncbi:hypothetical protein ACGFX4_27080 [Kitasatospora sp. NPDC048365]|uniref:hypothetical protein n=1 Tax=Kitasatospora sp. NPDC048365 TaxID=3364050 RepID=UPI0037187E14